MSSVSPLQVASSIATPTSTPTSGGLPGITRSSSLLFGFLITFLALFVAFMACGVGSRRAMAIRRLRLLELAGDAPRRTRQPEPVLWDVYLKDGRDTWDNQMPLSAMLTRPPIRHVEMVPETPVSEPRHPLNFLPRRFLRILGISRPPPPPLTESDMARYRQMANDPSAFTSEESLFTTLSYWLPFWQRPVPARPPMSGTKKTEADGIHVSILIAMPSSRHRHYPTDSEKREIMEQERGSEPLGEYVLGVADIPWTSHDFP